MQLGALLKIFSSRKRFRNHFLKKSYIENILRQELDKLCAEFNIEPVNLVCSATDRLLFDANIMRAVKGIEPRTNDLSKTSFMITMHNCEFTNDRAHNKLVGIIVNMDLIMAIFKYNDTPHMVDKNADILKTLLRHEIGHIIVEGSVYENMSYNEAKETILARQKEELDALEAINDIIDNKLYARGYYQIPREAMANEAVGISIDEMCRIYSKF